MTTTMPADTPTRVTGSTATGLSPSLKGVPVILTLAGFPPDQMARLYEQFCAPLTLPSGTNNAGKNTAQHTDN